jgi:hypothetical protein
MESFEISDEQLNKIKSWTDTHQSCYTGAIGGRYTYCFSPTSLGVILNVKDIVTGNEIDVTEYSDW